MRNLKFFAACLLGAICFYGCTSEKSTAGIEIGNPAVESEVALSFTAGFSIDYSDVEPVVLDRPVVAVVSPVPLLKSASDDEPVLIDTLNLNLTEVRSYCSFYVGISVDPSMGLVVWPYENSSVVSLPISFTDEDLIDETFKNINLQTEGRLKEIGVSFEIMRSRSPFIRGRVLIKGKYVPFAYELSEFQIFSLRYHYSQIEVKDNVANLSVKFRVHNFVDGVDFSDAKQDDDGVIRITKESNSEIWDSLNTRFVSSFQALRYEYLGADGLDDSGYVNDVWMNVANSINENFITNGNFVTDNSDWILLTQLLGAADTTRILEKDSSYTMNVEVTNGGSYSYSVQLMHENVPIVAGHKYKCSFTIWSNKEGLITARLGSYLTYETEGFNEHVQVTKKKQNVEIEFVPEVDDPFARFELNLGGSERRFWIRDVEIVRIK